MHMSVRSIVGNMSITLICTECGDVVWQRTYLCIRLKSSRASGNELFAAPGALQMRPIYTPVILRFACHNAGIPCPWTPESSADQRYDGGACLGCLSVSRPAANRLWGLRMFRSMEGKAGGKHIVAHAAGFHVGLADRNSAVATLFACSPCARNARFIG
jgi:hypothetical protein